MVLPERERIRVIADWLLEAAQSGWKGITGLLAKGAALLAVMTNAHGLQMIRDETARTSHWFTDSADQE